MLAGGIKPSPLEQQTRLPLLDLWLDASGTILERWLKTITPFLRPDVEIQIAHSLGRLPTAYRGKPIKLMAERVAYRGPAGVARDCCATLSPVSSILIVDAARWVPVDIAPMFAVREASGAATVVGVNPDRSPAGLYLTNRAALEHVPVKGFMDIKEQWLPRVQEQDKNLYVYRFPEPGTHQLRTVEQMIDAACGHHKGPVYLRGTHHCAQSSVADGATVDPSATIVRSIVMPGAIVEEGAAVIGSVVCPGARAAAGAHIIDSVLSYRGDSIDARVS
jgi:hypothetical protein